MLSNATRERLSTALHREPKAQTTSSEVLGFQTMAPLLRAARIPLSILVLTVISGLVATRVNPDAQSSNSKEAEKVLQSGPQRTPMYTDIVIVKPEPYAGTVKPGDLDSNEAGSFNGKTSPAR